LAQALPKQTSSTHKLYSRAMPSRISAWKSPPASKSMKSNTRSAPEFRPPPGLEGITLQPPRGFEKFLPISASPSGVPKVSPKSATVSPKGAEDIADNTVQVSNMPKHIASKQMFEAMLQQAQLDKSVLSFVTSLNGLCGEARVTLTDKDAALRCAAHFNGRCWGGIVVSAKLMVSSSPTKSLSPDAPVFVPTFALSAKAPEFNPVPVVTKDVRAPISMTSEASTDDGESASDDDKESASEWSTQRVH